VNLEIFLSDIPAAVLYAREKRTIALLRATRPGRKSRQIFARTIEDALWSGDELRRAATAESKAVHAYRYLRPGVPRRDVQTRLNAVLTRGASS
jgi:hypothetical protein